MLDAFTSEPPTSSAFDASRQQGLGQERRGEVPVELRERDFRHRYDKYTVGSERLIAEIKEAQEYTDYDLLRDLAFDVVARDGGLVYGKEAAGYVEDGRIPRFALAGLMTMFTTVEGMMSRPETTEVDRALNEALTVDAIEVTRYASNQDNWRNRARRRISRTLSAFDPNGDNEVETHLRKEEEKIKKLVETGDQMRGLRDFVEARRARDLAFRHRASVCKVDGKEIDSIKTGNAPEPDKSEWMAEYQFDPELGKAQSKVERMIERIGTGLVHIEGIDNPRNMFIDGFKTAREFELLLLKLLEESEVRGEKRMDVVWYAWQEAIMDGTITRFAWSVDENGKYKFGNPPLVSDLDSNHIHSEKKRLVEFGVSAFDVDGNVVDPDSMEVWGFERDSKGKIAGNRSFVLSAERNGYEVWEKHFEEKYLKHMRRLSGKREIAMPGGKTHVETYPKPPNISHSGRPQSLGRYGRLYDTYLRDTKVKDWEDPYGRVHPEISLHEIFFKWEVDKSDPRFPWFATEDRTGTYDTEMPSSSVGLRNLRRLRAQVVRGQYVLERETPVQKISFAELTTGEIRTLGDKMGLVKPGRLINGRPTNPFVWYLIGVFAGNPLSIRKDCPYVQGERSIRVKDRVGKSGRVGEGASNKELSEFDVLTNSLSLGLISQEEDKFIREVVLNEPAYTTETYAQPKSKVGKGMTKVINALGDI